MLQKLIAILVGTALVLPSQPLSAAPTPSRQGRCADAFATQTIVAAVLAIRGPRAFNLRKMLWRIRETVPLKQLQKIATITHPEHIAIPGFLLMTSHHPLVRIQAVEKIVELSVLLGEQYLLYALENDSNEEVRYVADRGLTAYYANSSDEENWAALENHALRGDQDVNIANIGLEAGPHEEVNEVLRRAFDAKRYELAGTYKGIAICKILGLNKLTGNQAAHAGPTRHSIYVAEGSFNEETVNHELAELVLWEAQALKLKKKSDLDWGHLSIKERRFYMANLRQFVAKLSTADREALIDSLDQAATLKGKSIAVTPATPTDRLVQILSAPTQPIEDRRAALWELGIRTEFSLLSAFQRSPLKDAASRLLKKLAGNRLRALEPKSISSKPLALKLSDITPDREVLILTAIQTASRGQLLTWLEDAWQTDRPGRHFLRLTTVLQSILEQRAAWAGLGGLRQMKTGTLKIGSERFRLLIRHIHNELTSGPSGGRPSTDPDPSADSWLVVKIWNAALRALHTNPANNAAQLVRMLLAGPLVEQAGLWTAVHYLGIFNPASPWFADAVQMGALFFGVVMHGDRFWQTADASSPSKIRLTNGLRVVWPIVAVGGLSLVLGGRFYAATGTSLFMGLAAAQSAFNYFQGARKIFHQTMMPYRHFLAAA
jgi:hypothetical protein